MFDRVIHLYRICGRPPIIGSAFSYEGVASQEIRAAITGCEELLEQYGQFSGPPEFEREGRVTFEWRLAANENARFYESVSALADGSFSPSRGVMPGGYYITEIDYAAGEAPPPEEVARLISLASLVSELGKIAQPVQGGPADPLTLLFVLPADDKDPPKTIQLVTRILSPMLQMSEPDLGPLRALTAQGEAGLLHQEERRSLFRLAVADVLGNKGHATAELSQLVSQWGRVLSKYQHDVDAYISRFSFEKLRKEISQAELDFLVKLQGVLGDGATKLIGLPLSLAAVIGIYHASSLVESMLLALGSLMITGLFSAYARNQRLQLDRVRDAFDVMFDPFDKKVEGYPESLKASLRNATTGFGVQFRFSVCLLTMFRFISWFPTLLAVTAVSYRYNEPFRTWVTFWANSVLL